MTTTIGQWLMCAIVGACAVAAWTMVVMLIIEYWHYLKRKRQSPKRYPFDNH